MNDFLEFAAYLPFAVAFVLSVGVGYCVLGPFVADHVHGHVLHLNHQQPLQKAAFAPMQLAGRLTRHSAPVTANKIAMSDLQPQGEIQKGKVKWFDPIKGFGFITVGGDEVFVHQRQIYSEGYRSLADGEDVEFKIRTDPTTGRPAAYEVTGPGGNYVTASKMAMSDLQPEGKIHFGKVVQWDDAKGFGFLAPKGGGPDVFVYKQEILGKGYRSLVDGEDVEFTIRTDPSNGKLRAYDVTRSGGADNLGGIQKGKVVQWNDNKGFGFIAVKGGGRERRRVFVHRSTIYAQGYQSLAVGEDVEFKMPSSEFPRGRGEHRKAYEVTGPGGNYVQGSYDFILTKQSHDQKQQASN